MRFFPALILVLASCSAPDIPRLPPIGIGGGGARLMHDAKNPAEAYENAYAALTGCHNRVRSGLGSGAGQNFLDAEGALEEIVESLRVMRALVEPSAQAGFDPYIEDYSSLAVDVGRRNPPANWRTRVDVGEKEIKSKFSYAQAPIVAQWPSGMGPRTEAATPSGPTSASPTNTPSPPQPAKAPDVPIRLAFKAWKQSHADLLAAFEAGRDAGSAYSDVQEALAVVKKGVPSSRHAKIDLMLAVYEQQHVETKGFSEVPPNGSKELIRKQLDVVRETLELEYDPDRK